jgi:bacterioferritin
VKGDKEILKNLQNLLNYELAARDQYLAHSRKYQDWGLTKLHAQMDHEMQEEQQHIDAIMNRMLFLEGDPDFTQRENPEVGNDVETMLRNDLEAEVDVAQLLRVTMQMCEEKNDYDTRDILQVLLHDTEMDHIYWLEQQLGLIEKIGLPNYLQNQM